jgi:CheY-like chemotaxis protein
LNNAAKFTPEGGSIRVELEDSGDPIAVRVADSGIGVPGEQLERIFQMFTRLERPGVRTQPGLGIGLALARRLAEMHGGTLSASSAGVAQGTTFTLSLPRPSSTDQRARPAIAPVSSTEAGPVPRLKIVLVEDNHDVLETMSKWLRSLGHDVWGTEAGRTAVQLAGEVRPDMVLCDLGLPGMDGIEVCRQIRSLPPPGQRSAPVMVALTGWGREEDRAKTKQAGFDHHLVKPVKAEQLQKVIAAVVATPP